MNGFKLEVKGLNNLLKNFNKYSKEIGIIYQSGIVHGAEEFEKSAKQEAPVKTGNLRRKIKKEISPLKAVIGPKNVPYARYVHEGTRPHIITPKKKKALFWEGAMHPVKMVRHPGTNANPFMKRAFRITRPKVVRLFKKINNNLVKNLAK